MKKQSSHVTLQCFRTCTGNGAPFTTSQQEREKQIAAGAGAQRALPQIAAFSSCSRKEAAFGRYIAMTTCGHCHGPNLHGASNSDFTSPSLRVVAAYSPEAFAQLLRTGVALGGRKLGLMREVALNNLSQLTDAEIAALYSYLHAMPETARN